jgi:hypothetical protein
MKPLEDSGTQTIGGHVWQYFLAGDAAQAAIRTGADIAAVPQLDLKAWAALEMPVAGTALDPATLALLDTDGDGRIRPPELCAAVAWAKASFKSLDPLLAGGESVALANIADEKLRTVAVKALALLGKEHESAITLADVRAVEEKMAKDPANGDGVVTAASTSDPALSAALADIAKAAPGKNDRCGAAGVDAESYAAFHKNAGEYLLWLEKPKADGALLPLGDKTAVAWEAFAAVKAKGDDYFARVRLAGFAMSSEQFLNPVDAVKAAAVGELAPDAPSIAALPLSFVLPNARLPLEEGVNPAWEGRMAAFASLVAEPLLGKTPYVSFAQWESLKDRFAPYAAWLAARPCEAPGGLAPERLAELSGEALAGRIAALLAEDLAAAPVFEALASLEKLVRFQRDLVRVLRNFVNFADFYEKRDGVFQTGTLYLDSRACRLCVDVADAGKHAALAGLSGMYLAYCSIERKGEAPRTIAAAFTSGGGDNLMVGRGGVFYDRQGRDWDARVTKIIANPVSLGEAFWSPYKKLQRYIEEMVAKRAATSEAGVTGGMTGAVDQLASGAGKTPAAPKKIDVGTVAALGVAFAAAGTMLSVLATGLMGLSWWQFPIVLAAAILLISTPSVIMAYLKLRRRNIAPLLDANGWAVNARAKVGARFGAALTARARIPAGAVARLKGPFAEKKSHKFLVTVLLVVILALAAGAWYANKCGLIHQWTNGRIGTPQAKVVPAAAPAPESPKPVVTK